MIKIANTITFILLIGYSTSYHGHLDYEDQSKWGDTCQTGAHQSPISLPPSNQMILLNDIFILANNSYHPIKAKALEMVHEYKYLLDATQSNSSLLIRSQGIEYRYVLQDIHFHFKSEHFIGNKQLAIEMHMVHKKDSSYVTYSGEDPDSKHQFMVIGVMFMVGRKQNQFIESLNFSSKAPVKSVELKQFAEEGSAYVYYQGSLTTPKCDEAVHWVLKDEIESLSQGQFDDIVKWIAKDYPRGNARQIYKLNNRPIYFVNAQNSLCKWRGGHPRLQAHLLLLKGKASITCYPFN